MCGIVGVVGRWLPAAAEREQALSALRHRGPDEEGAHLGEGVWLGMRRLSIIDLEHGRQPVRDESGEILAVLNGEIYNYLELQRELRGRGHELRSSSDSEVLVHLFEELDERLCARLHGMFAFALWDGRRRRLLLARDRFGKKPLYLKRLAGGGLAFASELKALVPLLHAAAEPPRIRAQSVYDYLSLAAVPQPATIYEGVEVLPPAHVAVLDDQDLQIRPYWRLERHPRLSASYADARREVRSRIGRAVTLRLRADVPLGVFLSSGVDSSVVAYEAAQKVGDQLRTFTVSVPDAALDEAPVARRTAEAFGVRNDVLRLELAPLESVLRIARHWDQPFADPSAIPTIAVSELAREHVTVVLNGDGGDETFAGYRRYWAARAADRLGPARPLLAAALAHLPGNGRRSTTGFLRRLGRGLTLPAADRYLVWTNDLLGERDKAPWWRGGEVRPTEDWLAGHLRGCSSLLEEHLQGDLGVNLLSGLLVKMDMASMACSLEARSPLLDHELAEFAARLPASYGVRGTRLKAVLRDAYRDVLPAEVANGAKRGFEIPLAAWLQEDLRELVADTLGASDARVTDYVDAGLVRAVLDDRALREHNLPALTYALLMLELWLREEPWRVSC